MNGRARIGVVADTHCPEFLATLPSTLESSLRGVDLILHCGDVGGRGGQSTLAALQAIAPVTAVRGDHDRGLDLPATAVVDVLGHRVGVVHGNRGHFVEEPLTLVGTLSLGLAWPRSGLDGWLVKRLPGCEVIVHGHTHAPEIRRRSGILLFNPGAVYQVTPEMARQRLAASPDWFEWSWLQVIRHRRRWPAPSVGILEFSAAGITASVIPL